jgi:hypothetical protein
MRWRVGGSPSCPLLQRRRKVRRVVNAGDLPRRALRSSHRAAVQRAWIVGPRSLRGCAVGGSGPGVLRRRAGPTSSSALRATEDKKGGTSEHRWEARSCGPVRSTGVPPVSGMHAARRCKLGEAAATPPPGRRPVLRRTGDEAAQCMKWKLVEDTTRMPHQAARALRRSAASMRAMTRRVLSLSSAPKRSCTYASASSHRPAARCSDTD